MKNQATINTTKTMGTLPVFMTAVSTILGAILFLKFGYSLGHVGLLGTLLIILLGHLVTIPTAMAVAEIATNQKVEGGGAYYIISRSFGINIGGSIGIALYLAQAISIAFYIIAFGEALEPYRIWIMETYGLEIYKSSITFALMAMLSVLILTRGANMGVKALYFVVAILAVSLAMFFMGSSYSEHAGSITETIADKGKPTDSFFYVFAIIFPAFTGIAAGLGLSGDLKEPRISIPRGTLWATVVGIIIYTLVSVKLFYSASPEDLANEESLIMSKIAVWPHIIPIGLAAAAISSALGSIMIAPRTLQALGNDRVFPGIKANQILNKARKSDAEPVNATIITCLIAFAFLTLGDINVVAEIISMFFMVTYGAICMISFFEHFAADPSYRPTFRSKWYISLMGGLLCFWLMFKMNSAYAILAIALMVGIYIWITKVKNDSSGLANLFKGVIFQVSRSLQIFLQRRDAEKKDDNWRPFMVTFSENSFKRTTALQMTSWISYKYGFGTYHHYIQGTFDAKNKADSDQVVNRLLDVAKGIKNKVYLDTTISENHTLALSSILQEANVSGNENNMILLEYREDELDQFDYFFENYNLLETSKMDICVQRSSVRGFGLMKNIHIWITTTDFVNSNLMILLGYIILGHPDWNKAEIKIHSIYDIDDFESKKERLQTLITEGRLPISSNNIEMIQQGEGETPKDIINRTSTDSDLTIIGFDDPDIYKEGKKVFEGYPELGNILFVNAFEVKEIK
ncbi:MAG: amino acid permease [Crocinitomicaceae bacterium]